MYKTGDKGVSFKYDGWLGILNWSVERLRCGLLTVYQDKQIEFGEIAQAGGGGTVFGFGLFAGFLDNGKRSLHIPLEKQSKRLGNGEPWREDIAVLHERVVGAENRFLAREVTAELHQNQPAWMIGIYPHRTVKKGYHGHGSAFPVNSHNLTSAIGSPTEFAIPFVTRQFPKSDRKEYGELDVHAFSGQPVTIRDIRLLQGFPQEEERS